VRVVPLVGPELTNRHLIGCLEKRRGLRVIRAFLELAAA
ncbi:LysR family transcriptional regulator, partial [Pseudomonas aeruginosa]